MSLFERFLGWLASKLPSTTITIGGTPYLTRCYLFGKDRAWGNVYLHRFHASDRGDDLHNHPWAWGLSLILAGGYSEEYLTEEVHDEVSWSWDVRRRVVPPWSFHRIRSGDFHRVDLLDPRGAWTLFVAGPRTSDWGFWDRRTRRFKNWRENPEAIP
jgi:hypothetical protein